MKKIYAVLTFLLISVYLTSTAWGFGLGVAPAAIEKGSLEPGDSFTASFKVLSTSGREINISMDVSHGNIDYFEEIRGDDVEEFSQQSCTNCFELLKGGGRLEKRDESLETREDEVDRWQDVEFLVNLPENIEPGYHLFMITPHPSTTGGGGDVGVKSTSSIPMIFRIEGSAVRSGKILGIKSTSRPRGEEIKSTFYNNGTVTVETDFRLIVETENGNETVNLGSKKVPPKETASFKTYLSRTKVPKNYEVKAVSEFTTGKTTSKSELSVGEVKEIEVKEGSGSLNILIGGIIILISSLVTWKLINHVRK